MHGLVLFFLFLIVLCRGLWGVVGVKGGAKVSTKNGPEIIMVSFSELSLFCKKEKTSL